MITDLGNSINSTLQKLFKGTVTDETIESSLRDICTSLIKSNVSPRLVSHFRTQIKEQISKEKLESNANKAKVVHKIFFDTLVKFLDPGTKPYEIKKGRCNVIVFVGLQGCGKTTSICKYGNFYRKKGFRVGIVCADTFRAGAFDQIKQNASKIGIPYYGSSDPDPVKVAKEGVSKFRKSDFELILVDTSGRHTQEEALFTEMKELVGEINPDDIVFVMDAGIGQSAEEQAIGFKNAVKVGGIILTKVDGSQKAGGALSSVAATGCSIEFVGMGEGMEDFERFDSNRFVGRMLGMGDLEGIIERFTSIDIDQEDMIEKLSTGKFRLIDFKNIYKQIMSLGPISKMIEMIPGMNNLPIPDESKFRRIMFMFDSMNKKELESSGEIFLKEPKRIERIARGSGTTKELVTETLGSFRQMSSMMKKMMGNPMFSQLLKGTIEEKDKKKIIEKAKGKVPSGILDYIESLN